MKEHIKEGDLYKCVDAYGERFELYYGYYEDFERVSGEPIPIYPDFLASPRYTKDGYPFATQMQDMCEDGCFRREDLQDRCCGNCSYFSPAEDLLGICVRKKQERNTPLGKENPT